MPGVVPATAAAAGPLLLSRLAVLFSRQMAAAGLGEGGGFEAEKPIEASPPRPRPPQPKQRQRLAVAFSGGPDSAALGMLAGWWAGTSRPPFAAIEAALRAEREREKASFCSLRSPPPLPLSLALERWWKESSIILPGEMERSSCSFSASFLESERERDNDNGRGEDDDDDDDEDEKGGGGGAGGGEKEKGPLLPPLPPPLALVVDHGLRPGSRETAERAALLARSLGLEPLVLEARWPSEEEEEEGDKKRKKKTLEAARDARFAVLLSAASDSNSPSSSPSSISALLLGHHADDQAETVALRLLRASGPAGMSGIAPQSWLRLPPPTTTTAAETTTPSLPTPLPSPLLLCLRPLLSVPKSALLEGLSAAGVTGWVRDPSNADLGAPRNRLRALLAGAAAEEAARGRGGAGTGKGASSSSSSPLLPSLRRPQERESRRAAAAANRLAAALRARRLRVESRAASALEAAGLCQVAPSDVSSSFPASSLSLRLAPLVSAGETAGKAALAVTLGAVAAAAAEAARGTATTTSPFSSSEAAAARLWASISSASGGESESESGRLRGAFTGARCVVRPVPGSEGREIVVRSAEGDERERGKAREGRAAVTRKT